MAVSWQPSLAHGYQHHLVGSVVGIGDQGRFGIGSFPVSKIPEIFLCSDGSVGKLYLPLYVIHIFGIAERAYRRRIYSHLLNNGVGTSVAVGHGKHHL